MKRQLYLLLLLLFSFSTQAQEEWSLVRCIEHALENNLSIGQAQIGADFAKIDQKQAKHARMPNLNFSSSLNSNFGLATDPITNTNVTQNFVSNGLQLSSGVTVFNGFRISNSIKQTTLDALASEYDLEHTRRNTAIFVANGYLNVLAAQENVEISKTQLLTSQEQLVQTQRLIDAGVRPANEALDIEAQIANNEQLVISAENNEELALLELKQLLLLDPNVSMVLVVPENLSVESDPDILEFEQVYNSAIKNQYDIKAADTRIESAVLGKKVAEAGLFPSVNLFASIGSSYTNKGQRIDGFVDQVFEDDLIINGQPVTIEQTQQVPVFSDNPYFNQLDENLSYGFGVSLNYPIYNNYSNRGSIERAKLNILNAENQSEQARQGLKNTIQQALAGAKAAKKRLNAANRSLEAQNASFNNAEKRFNAGTINTFEYVSIKNSQLEAQVNAVLAKYEYVFAVKVLDFYMGKPINI